MKMNIFQGNLKDVSAKKASLVATSPHHIRRPLQCFLFYNKIKYFLNTLIQKRFLEVMKIANIRGELTDISAKKEALVHLVCEIHLPIHPKLCYVTLSLK